MNYEQLMKNFDTLNERIKAAHKEMQETSEGLIEEAAKRFLGNCPEVTGVHWTQYTPYFNDGDSCEFSVNEFCFHILDDEDDELDYFYDSTTIYSQADLDEAIKDLEVAKEYVANVPAWEEKFCREYREKYGRDYPLSTYNRPKPWPSEPERAQERIDKIKVSLEKYTPEVADRILKHFKEFKSAMNLVPSDIMNSVYGDHVSVVINREGTHVDEYQHD